MLPRAAIGLAGGKSRRKRNKGLRRKKKEGKSDSTPVGLAVTLLGSSGDGGMWVSLPCDAEPSFLLLFHISLLLLLASLPAVSAHTWVSARRQPFLIHLAA